MKQKLSMKARNEVISKQHPRYVKASKKEKTEIISIVCEATGLSRDRAARVLRKGILKESTKPKGKRGPKKKYGIDVLAP